MRAGIVEASLLAEGDSPTRAISVAPEHALAHARWRRIGEGEGLIIPIFKANLMNVGSN